MSWYIINSTAKISHILHLKLEKQYQKYKAVAKLFSVSIICNLIFHKVQNRKYTYLDLLNFAIIITKVKNPNSNVWDHRFEEFYFNAETALHEVSVLELVEWLTIPIKKLESM